MLTGPHNLASQLQNVRSRIGRAAALAARDPASITLVATLSLYGAATSYFLMRTLGLDLAISVLTLAALFFGGLLLTAWLAVRRLPSGWCDIDNDTALTVF